MDRRGGVPSGRSRQGVGREGGLQGPGSEEVEGTALASGQRRVPGRPRGGH